MEWGRTTRAATNAAAQGKTRTRAARSRSAHTLNHSPVCHAAACARVTSSQMASIPRLPLPVKVTASRTLFLYRARCSKPAWRASPQMWGTTSHDLQARRSAGTQPMT